MKENTKKHLSNLTSTEISFMPGMVVHACNSALTWEAETELLSQAQGQSVLHSFRPVRHI